MIDKLLELHEGYRSHPYLDSEGLLTIGIGLNIHPEGPKKGPGLSREAARFIVREHLRDVVYRLEREVEPYIWLDEVRRAVLQDMAYNLGVDGLLKFRTMIGALMTFDYEGAVAGMKKSKWWTQVGRRAERLAEMMLTGEWPKELTNGTVQ